MTQPPPGATPPPQAEGPANVSVLIVDDDPDIRRTLHEILADEGYSVAEARHGAEAMQLLKVTTPALILLDLNMPVMDGDEFRQLQRRIPEIASIPVVILSAIDRMRARVADLEPDDAIPKPADLHQLLATVERFCKSA